MKYVQRMRDLREDHDFTQKDVADKLSIERSYYGRLTNSNYKFHYITPFRLSPVPLNIHISDFLTFLKFSNDP